MPATQSNTSTLTASVRHAVDRTGPVLWFGGGTLLVTVVLLVVFFTLGEHPAFTGHAWVTVRIALLVPLLAAGFATGVLVSVGVYGWWIRNILRAGTSYFAEQFDGQYLGIWQKAGKPAEKVHVWSTGTGWLVIAEVNTYTPFRVPCARVTYTARPLGDPTHTALTFQVEGLLDTAEQQHERSPLEPYLATIITEALDSHEALHTAGYEPSIPAPVLKSVRWRYAAAAVGIAAPFAIGLSVMVTLHFDESEFVHARDIVTADTTATPISWKLDKGRRSTDCAVTVQWTPPGRSAAQTQTFDDWRMEDQCHPPRTDDTTFTRYPRTTEYPVEYPTWDVDQWTARPGGLRAPLNHLPPFIPLYAVLAALLGVALGGLLTAATQQAPRFRR